MHANRPHAIARFARSRNTVGSVVLRNSILCSWKALRGPEQFNTAALYSSKALRTAGGQVA